MTRSGSLLAILGILTTGLFQMANGQVRVTHINNPAAVAGKKGMIYALPRNVLAIDIWVLKEQRFPGPYAQYAQEYLGTQNIIQSQSTEYHLGDISIRSFPEPDPEHYYLIEHDEKSTGSLGLTYSKSGLIMGIEETRGSAGVEGLSGWDPAAFAKIDVSSLYSAYSRPELVEKIDTVLRRITIDTASVTKMELRYSYVPRSDKDMARDVLSRIHRIEQDRYNLLVGYQETPYSREVLEFMLKQLDQMKSEYLKLFTGTTIKESVCFTLLFLPEKAGEEFVLAGFSPASGLTQGSGSEIKIALKAAENTAKIGNDPAPTGASTGYCYRIPESVEVIVSFQGKSLALARLMISQLGVVRTLPPDAGKVELDPETGSLIRVFVD